MKKVWQSPMTFTTNSVVTLIIGIIVVECPALISSSPIKINTTAAATATPVSSWAPFPSESKSISSLAENVSTENINNPPPSYSFGKKVVLTNVKRQIGNSSENPILNLHEKVNGQEGRGGQELSVTDVSPSSEFRATGLFKSNMRGNGNSSSSKSSVRDGRKALESSSYSNSARPRSESNTTATSTSTADTATATETFTSDGKHSGYVNLDLKSDRSTTTRPKSGGSMGNSSNNVRGNGSDRSFAIRKDVRTEETAGRSVSSTPSDGTRRYKKMSVNDVYNAEPSHSPGVSVPDAKTDHEDDKGIPTFSNGTGNDRWGHGVGLCSPVIVNQTESNTLNDLDKWTRTVVKISQCISSCMHRKAVLTSHPSSAFTMSLKKKGGRLNERGGGASPPPPSEISLPIHTPRDVITNKSNENKKLLSSCQKSCKLLPRKSTLTTGGGGLGPGEPSTPRTKKNGFPEETNKREEEAEINKNPTGGRRRTPAESAVSRNGRMRRTPMERADLGLEITRSDTTGLFHLHWPKMVPSSSSSSPLSSPSSSLTLWWWWPIVYSVMLEEATPSGNHRWKLIDQTVATQTQISLEEPRPSDACQGEKETLTDLEEENSFGNESRRQKKQVTNIIWGIRVIAVNAEGLVEKVFSARISCSCPVDRADKKKDDHQKRNKFVTSGNEIKHEAYSSNEGRREEYGVLDENSNQISTASASFSSQRRTSSPLSSTVFKNESTIGGKTSRKGEQMNKGERKVEAEKVPMKSLSSPVSPTIFLSGGSSWSLRMVSMVHQDSLVVTEVSWKVPSGLSNQGNDSSDVTRQSPPRDGLEEEEMRNHKYHFLLTWEIFGGGLRGNLVTDTTSGSISLWPDTAYFIQVGLINTPNPSESPIPREEQTKPGEISRSPSSGRNSPSSSYYPEQSEDESIIFPLSEDLVEPQVTLRSERLLVNTSKVVEEEISSSSSPTSSLVKTPQSSSTSRRISGKSTSSSNVYKSEVREPFYFQGWVKNVSEIAMGTSVVSMLSRNGNEINDQSEMKSTVGKPPPHPLQPPSDTLERSHSAVQQQRSKSMRIGGVSSSKGSSSNNRPATTTNVDGSSLRGKKYENYYHYHKHHEGYLGDSPGASKRLGYYDEAEVVGGVHRSSLGSNTLGKNSSGTNGYEDKKSNINDNKSNNNLKPKITFTSSSSSATSASGGGGGRSGGTSSDGPRDDHSSSKATKVLSGSKGSSSSSATSSGGIGFRPDVYQDLFAIDSATAFQTVPISAVATRKDQSNDFANYNGSNLASSSSSSYSEQDRPSAVYSIFVLVVVACVIFLFLVAIIGFFVVTSSIRTTAQYFVPKRIRVWIVGRSQDELLRRSSNSRDRDDDDGEDEEEEEFYGNSYYDEFDDRDDCCNNDEGADWNNGISTTTMPSSFNPEVTQDEGCSTEAATVEVQQST